MLIHSFPLRTYPGLFYLILILFFFFYLLFCALFFLFFFFFQAEDGIRDLIVTGVQTCALPIYLRCAGRPSRGAVPAGLEEQPRRHPRHPVSHCLGRAAVAHPLARRPTTRSAPGTGPRLTRRGAGPVGGCRNETEPGPRCPDRSEGDRDPHRAALHGRRVHPYLLADVATCRGSLVLPPGSNHHAAATAGPEAAQHRSDPVLPRAGHRPSNS